MDPQTFSFSPPLEEMINFDEHIFQMGGSTTSLDGKAQFLILWYFQLRPFHKKPGLISSGYQILAKFENDNIRHIFQCKGGRFNLGAEQLTFSKF